MKIIILHFTPFGKWNIPIAKMQVALLGCACDVRNCIWRKIGGFKMPIFGYK